MKDIYKLSTTIITIYDEETETNILNVWYKDLEHCLIHIIFIIYHFHNQAIEWLKHC